jgi:isoleucyl-tRNA synthetase
VADPAATAAVDESRWEQLLAVRALAAAELEKARQQGTIGKSLEAQVEIAPDSEATAQLLAADAAQLPMLLIVSQVRLAPVTAGATTVRVSPAAGQKCVRCWRFSEDVGRDLAHGALCARCAEVLRQL